MYIIQSKNDNSFFEGFEMLGSYNVQAFSWQLEDAKVFHSFAEAESAKQSISDKSAVIVPLPVLNTF